MDSFTQKLLERTQARREALNAKFAQIPHPVPRKRRSPLQEETNGGGGSKLSTGNVFIQEENNDDSPEKRHCLQESRQETKENDSDFHSDLKNRTLATTETSNVKSHITPVVQKRSSVTPNPRGRTSRLAALAAHINNWEDDSQSRGTGPIREQRPPLESNSTPPHSSCGGSSLSSSSGPRTLSSSSSDNAPPPPPPPLPVSGSPVQTPKFKLIDSIVPALKETSEDPQKSRVVKSPSLKSSESVSQQKGQTPKKVVWDRAIVATLEAQGFVQSLSKSKLEYKFKGNTGRVTTGKKGKPSSDIDTSSEEKELSPKHSSEVSDCTKKRSVKDLARKFDTPVSNCNLWSGKDPAELPLSARVAMFEKSSSSFLPVPNRPVSVTNSSNNQSQAANKPQAKSFITPPAKEQRNPDVASLSPTKVGQHTFEIQRKLFENAGKNWKSNEITAKVKEDRQKDMDVVLNRWTYGKKILESKSPFNNGEKAEYRVLSSTTSSDSCNTEVSSNENESATDDDTGDESKCESVNSKRAHVPLPPPMPTISFSAAQSRVQEDDEEDDDDDDVDDSVDCESHDSYDRLSDPEDQRRAVENVENVFSEIDNLSTESEEIEEHDMLHVANEQLANTTDFNSSILKAAFQEIDTHGTKEVDAFSIRRDVHPTAISEVSKYSQSRSASVDYVSDVVKEELPLMHTVSFYRRQKEVNKTPIKVIVRKEDVSSPTSPRSPSYGIFSSTGSDEFRAFIQDKIKELQEDANAQLIIMSQASQALNLCRSTAEFHGSAEQIEGERLLLISSQRRQACLNEIQRLKTEGALGDVSANGSVMNKGSLTLGEMKLSLKKEFLAQTDSGKSGEFVHYFVCLVKHRGQVIATQMVSTLDGISAGAFHLPNLINVRDLDHDFNVLFEVYGLQTNRENLSKGKKTLSSRKEKSKLTLTPKKRASKQDSRMTSPAIQSPGGPSAICTSSFSMIGFTMINIKSLQRKQWTLEKVPFVSPLEGNLFMKVQCHTDSHIDEQGFLTMFEDVSGFGAWHRRWFHLTRRYLSYWKYPDDVKRKEPIGRIDLCECVTSEVSLVPRDICARPHTLMLLVVRPPSEDDTNTLVSQSYNTYTSTKVLLSADTKEERIAWCQYFNEALKCLRMWDPHALRPIPSD